MTPAGCDTHAGDPAHHGLCEEAVARNAAPHSIDVPTWRGLRMLFRKIWRLAVFMTVFYLGAFLRDASGG